MISSSPGRYARHEMLPEIGVAGQRKLSQGSVLIVGCGALGGFQAELLARAGVGRLRIADPDIVELHNLHRQILYRESDAESKVLKVKAAAKRLGEVNSGVVVETLSERFSVQNSQSLLAGMDVVLDATDNFETRYLLN
ncbi:MAG: HesA/MoeB/ThiF family protein, partial [Syntrophobacteraceae bacterium]